MLMISIEGTPIGGEDARTNNWIDQIAKSAACQHLALHFTILPGRKVDIDNLLRPAIRGLQKARLIQRACEGLDSVTALKRSGCPEGLIIESLKPDVPGTCEMDVGFGGLPIGDRNGTWIADWASQIQSAWNKPTICEPVFVHLQLATSYSIVELAKPILDGLEPLLGRDQNGRSAYYPNDHLIEWLQIERVESALPLRLQAGRIQH